VLQTPTFLRSNILYSSPLPTILRCGWDSIPGAKNYRIDVSEDSSFVAFIPGLQNWLPNRTNFNTYYSDSRIAFPLYPQKTTGATILGVQPSRTYYLRVRAENEFTTSAYSTTLTIQTQVVGIPRFLVIPTKITANSCALAWTILNNMTEYLITTVPGNIGRRVRGNRAIIDNLLPQTTYTMTVTALSDPSLTQTITIQTADKTVKILEELITFQSRALVGINDSSLFFRSTDSLSLMQAKQVLEQMQNDGVKMDSAWFHEGGRIRLEGVPIPTSENILEFVRSSFTVKLKESSQNMGKYNFVQGIADWRYSDYFDATSTTSLNYRVHPYRYYLYTFSNVTSDVKVLDANLKMQVYPNPVSPESIVSYTLDKPTVMTAELFDVSGRLIKAFFQNKLQMGKQIFLLHSQEISSGIYFLRLSQNSQVVQTIQVQIY
jgi:hypothetical protein